jgi:DNA-binding NarL/FixJ family response regulator
VSTPGERAAFRLFCKLGARTVRKGVSFDERQSVIRAQIVKLRAAGYTTDQIAHTLGLSKPTVSNYLRGIKARDLAQATG